MLYVICYMINSICYMLYVICYMLYAYKGRLICCMFVRVCVSVAIWAQALYDGKVPALLVEEPFGQRRARRRASLLVSTTRTALGTSSLSHRWECVHTRNLAGYDDGVVSPVNVCRTVSHVKKWTHTLSLAISLCGTLSVSLSVYFYRYAPPRRFVCVRGFVFRVSRRSFSKF